MGILHIAHTCSHLQNASRARLGLTSIANNKYNLRFVLALHRAGFLSSVTRAGPTPPDPAAILTGTHVEEVVTSANVASRRLWLGLKYWNNEPVLQKLKLYSKPSRLVWMSLEDLETVTRGFPKGMVKGLSLGECLFVSTDRGILEVREALEKKVGGQVLCVVS
ncbi:small subunit ribosomal protein S8 [Sporothrix schenckii 1099-18]|uniref:Small ribosomal subunit protein uS8m n=2 Tax=Sporothrix schenckii TaxID=29908 RepID=U7Q4R4_SPOS1|nr:small subunit ribosomal protein S8 [Sporothrix schenckii 1099-18]ERT01995.1 hypothetical protein HMPREF1624_00290 [Sporothrix schenckii ATCC 58251]KJR80830.1 small subunit ribosomal protein S8 [Sporothrix schenckii 1099-18]